jgi:hypothetical protein
MNFPRFEGVADGKRGQASMLAPICWASDISWFAWPAFSTFCFVTDAISSKDAEVFEGRASVQRRPPQVSDRLLIGVMLQRSLELNC